MTQDSGGDWQLADDSPYWTDEMGSPVDVPKRLVAAPRIDSQLARIPDLLRHWREHVALFQRASMHDGSHDLLARLDQGGFRVRTVRGGRKVDPSVLESGSAAQQAYRKRRRERMSRTPLPETDELREELLWPARAWRRRVPSG
jgi:hypothetical protein